MEFLSNLQACLLSKLRLYSTAEASSNSYHMAAISFAAISHDKLPRNLSANSNIGVQLIDATASDTNKTFIYSMISQSDNS